MLLGDTVRFYRLKKGISMEMLARQSDISSTFMYKIEKNKAQPTYNIMIRIVKALDISMDEFNKRLNNPDKGNTTQ